MRDKLASVIIALTCLAVVILAWNGNLGKALACLISPGIVEVTIHGSSNASSNASSGAHPQASAQSGLTAL